jgi:hypothetical protein
MTMLLDKNNSYYSMEMISQRQKCDATPAKYRLMDKISPQFQYLESSDNASLLSYSCSSTEEDEEMGRLELEERIPRVGSVVRFAEPLVTAVVFASRSLCSDMREADRHTLFYTPDELWNFKREVIMIAGARQLSVKMSQDDGGASSHSSSSMKSSTVSTVTVAAFIVMIFGTYFFHVVEKFEN